MEVRVPLAGPWSSVQPSKDMWTHHQTGHVGGCYPRCLQTLSCVSRVLRVNLLSSMTTTGCQCQIWQSQCSMGNANRAAWWAQAPAVDVGLHTVECHEVSDSLSRNVRFSRLPEIKGADSGSAAESLSTCGLLHISWCTGLSSGVSSILLQCAGRHSKPSSLPL